MKEKELNTDVNITVYTGGEEWEKIINRRSVIDDCLIPVDPHTFKFYVIDFIGNVFKHEYAYVFKGKYLIDTHIDGSLSDILNGFKDFRQFKSLALAFKACVKYDDEIAKVWFKDFSLLGYSTID